MNAKHEELLSHWVSIINEANSSGEKITKWLENNGIRRSQFYYWHKLANDAGLLSRDSGPESCEGSSTSNARPVPVIAQIHLSKESYSTEVGAAFVPHIMIMKNDYQVYVEQGVCSETLKDVMEVLGRC